jgi:hypothetical protein
LVVESLEHRLTPAALFYVGDATIVEGDAGTLNALVPITLMGQHGNKVTVDYRTVAGTAGAGSDYSSVAGTLTFNKNQTSTTIAIPIVGDRLAEANENFTLQLSKAKAATIADSVGVVTIADNEPRVHINDPTLLEGNSDTATMTFVVSLQAAYDLPVSVNYATADGTATLSGDYVAASGALTIPAGQTSANIDVSVNGDLELESNETVLVNLTTSDAYTTITDSVGVGTIQDDEPRISTYDGYQGYYESSITFYVYLSAPAADVVTVDFTTWDGSAFADWDYIATSGTLTFNPGDTVQTITVQLLSLAPDPYKNFYVQLTNPSANATLSTELATGYWNYDYWYYDYGW